MLLFIFCIIVGLGFFIISLLTPDALYTDWRFQSIIELTGKVGKVIIRSFVLIVGLFLIFVGIMGIVDK